MQDEVLRPIPPDIASLILVLQPVSAKTNLNSHRNKQNPTKNTSFQFQTQPYQRQQQQQQKGKKKTRVLEDKPRTNQPQLPSNPNNQNPIHKIIQNPRKTSHTEDREGNVGRGFSQALAPKLIDFLRWSELLRGKKTRDWGIRVSKKWMQMKLKLKSDLREKPPPSHQIESLRRKNSLLFFLSLFL